MMDLGTLNRGQSMLLNLYIKGYTHAQLSIYRHTIELIVFAPVRVDLSDAEMIVRHFMEDGDTIGIDNIDGSDGPFSTLQWRGHLIETEDE